MKTYIILTLIITFIMVFSPFLSLKKDAPQNETSEAVTTSSKETTTVQTEETTALAASQNTFSDKDLRKYIIGVLAGEMPASFCDEALKAQAVACYSYTLWLLENNTDFDGKTIMTQQNYISTKQMKEKWGDDFSENYKKIAAAADSVTGQYLAFYEKPAMTLFHAISSGNTVSAEEIFGEEFFYLKSVPAPGDNLCSQFEETVSFTAEEFKKAFENKGVVFSSDKPSTWAKVKNKDENGYISKLTVGDKTFSRKQVREILSLSGICFTATLENDCFVFTVHGKGHGVGMSQYSADYMARQGSTYEEILSHFYPGTNLVRE